MKKKNVYRVAYRGSLYAMYKLIIAEDFMSACNKAEENAIEQRAAALAEPKSIIGQDGSLQLSEETEEGDPWEIQTVELLSRDVLIV